jgi:hypothetical protein
MAGTCEYGKELFGFYKNAGNFLTSCKDWSTFQEGLCSMEQVSKLVFLYELYEFNLISL